MHDTFQTHNLHQNLAFLYPPDRALVHGRKTWKGLIVIMTLWTPRQTVLYGFLFWHPRVSAVLRVGVNIKW